MLYTKRKNKNTNIIKSEAPEDNNTAGRKLQEHNTEWAELQRAERE